MQTSTQKMKRDLSLPVAEIFYAMMGALFIALMARVSIPLWFTPVPLSGQTLAIMIVGVSSNTRLGLYTVGCYILQGAIGLPVFAGGAGGLQCLVGPTGGYILAWLLQVYLTSKVAQRFDRLGVYSSLFALIVVSLLHCFLGALWLGFFVSFKRCLVCGFYPFIPGDMAKCLLAMSYLMIFRKFKEA